MKTVRIPILLCCAILGVAHALKLPFGCVDAAESIYHLREILAGRVPYRDIFSHHFLGYLIPLYLANAVLKFSEIGFWTWVVVFQLTAALFAYLAVKQIASATQANLAAILVLTIGWFPNWEGNLFQNQAIYQPFLWLALLSLFSAHRKSSKAHLCLMGLAFGFLTTLDQRLIIFNALPLLSLYFTRKSLSPRSYLAVFGSWAILPVSALWYLSYHAALADFWHQTIVFPLLQRNANLGAAFGTRVYELLKAACCVHPIELILSLYALFVFTKHKISTHIKIFAITLALAGLGAASMGGRNYINYALFLAPAIILFLTLAWESPAKLGSYAKRAYQVSLITALTLASLAPIIRGLKYHQVQIQPETETLNALVELTHSERTAKDEILIWGYLPQFYLLTNSLSPFEDISFISIVGGNFTSDPNITQQTDSIMVAKFEKQMTDSPPKFFVQYLVNSNAVLSDPTFFKQKSLPSVPYPQAGLELPNQRRLREVLGLRYRKIGEMAGRYDGAIVYELDR